MSPTTPHPSPNKANFLPLPTPALPPKTPQQKRVSTTILGSTPLSCGSSIKQNQDGDTDKVDKYDRGDYDKYIREDLSRRVFVDYEVFMEYVLHVPVDWNTKWRPAIDAVIADANFKDYHEEYCGLCGKCETAEKRFYPPLVDIANAVLGVLFGSQFDGIPSEDLQYYHINDPYRVKGGVMNKNGLSPDLVLLHSGRPDPNVKNRSIHWANPLHVLEVKPYDNAICDGEHIPRLVVNGVDPIRNHAPPPTKLRCRPTPPNPLAGPLSLLMTSQLASEPTTTSTSKKRPADSSSAAESRATKKSKANSIDPQESSRPLESQPQEPSRPLEPQPQLESALQVCRYLLEMFSVPLFRSHATVSLVDRDRLQLYHANRSVVLVSSAIDFSQGEGRDKFIATIIAFHCLSLEQNGILASLVPGNEELLSKTVFRVNPKVVQDGKILRFSGSVGHEPFEVVLKDVVSRAPAMVGRSTLVIGVDCTCELFDGPLVLKISWPTSGRVSETEFLKKAEDMATGDHAWAADHLPKVHYAEDVSFHADSTSTLQSVAGLFEDPEVVNGNYVYEPRTLRIILQERLEPLKSLTNVRDIGQVFLDVACVHRWLYDHPGILHRDLSFNNIMYRLVDGKVYGVLTDYDLSSWTNSLNPDYTKTSQQRTGTPPYMAQELLKGTSPLHLYRHDVESLFYIMLLTSSRHTIGTHKDLETRRVIMRDPTELPYQDWFNEPRYRKLGSFKYSFLVGEEPIELSPDFEDFRPWLVGLQHRFAEGFKHKPTRKVPEWAVMTNVKPDAAQYDDETLGGCITYDTVLAAIPHLEGKLKGLEIRDRKRSSSPASPAPADAT